MQGGDVCDVWHVLVQHRTHLLSHCCHTVVTLLSHCCHTFVTLLLHSSYTVVTPLLHYSYTVVTLFLDWCYTVVSLLLHCLTCPHLTLHAPVPWDGDGDSADGDDHRNKRNVYLLLCSTRWLITSMVMSHGTLRRISLLLGPADTTAWITPDSIGVNHTMKYSKPVPRGSKTC
jgi:hypothetical protein